MTINTIKEKLHNYLENGDPKKVKAFYAMIEDEITEGESLTDDFVKELDKRVYEMENNLVKTYSLDEMISEARIKTKTKVKKYGAKNASKSKY
jgi:hypothetical protein